MTRTTMTRPVLPSSSIDDALLTPLSAEHIIRFVETTLTSPLPTHEQKAIRVFMNTASMSELSADVQACIDVKNNFIALAGLTNRQLKTMKNLIAERAPLKKQFKELHAAGKVDVALNKRILANAQKLLPFNHILEWWGQSTDRLNTQAWWEQVTVSSQKEGESKQETKEALIKRRHAINYVKNSWRQHQVVACYSSLNVMTYYKDHLLPLEKALTAALSEKPMQACVQHYLQHLLSQTGKLKRQLICSMLCRLQCAEYFNDLKCDDVVAYTCQQVEKGGKVTLKKTGKLPPNRRSLSLALIPRFINTIEMYCAEHPDENVLLAQLNQLKMKRVPTEWQSSDASLQTLAQHPVLTYFAHTFPVLFQQAREQQNLEAMILFGGGLDDRTFVLNKLHSLYKQARKRYKKIMHLYPHQANDEVALFFVATHERYKKWLIRINKKIAAVLDEQVQAALQQALTVEKLDQKKIQTLATLLNNAARFKQKYLHAEYAHHSDMVLAAAKQFTHLLMQQQVLSSVQCSNVFALIAACYPHLAREQRQRLQAQFAQLPALTRLVDKQNEIALLHFLLYHMELPLLDKNSFSQALARHRYVAKKAGGAWNNTVTLAAKGKQRKQAKAALIYISNVALPLSSMTPTLQLDNFDSNEVCVMLSDMEKTLEKNDDFFKIKQQFEAALLTKLNSIMLIKQYIRQTKHYPVRIEKLRALRDRIVNFFSDHAMKTQFLQTLSQACAEIMTTHYVLILRNNRPLDMQAFQSLKAVLGEEVTLLIRDNNLFQKALAYAIENYRGNHEYLSALLVEFIPISKSHANEMLILTYARKRLEYIKSTQAATPADYHFFAHFTTLPQIASLLHEEASCFNPFIEASNNPSLPWDKKTAGLIELFGNTHAVAAYRVKRLLELLNKDCRRHVQKESGVFNDFLSVLNTAKSPAVDRQIKNHAILRKTIDELIKGADWSLLLENIVAAYGSREQNEKLHHYLLTRNLIQTADFSDTWLGKQIAKHTTTEEETDKAFYETFFGSKHIKKQCLRLENMLLELLAVEADIHTHSHTEIDYKKALQQIQCIKPLHRLYQLYGNNDKAKHFLADIDVFEKKLYLRNKLHAVIDDGNFILNDTQNDSELHALIVRLLHIMKKIETKGIITPATIPSYLSFFDNEILTKLESSIENHSDHYSFQVLSALANFLYYLTSDSLKLTLLHFIQPQLNTNPYWFTLINHLGEAEATRDLTHKITTLKNSALISNEFTGILAFSERLAHVKQQTNAAIRQRLLVEAGIALTAKDSHIESKRLLSSTAISSSQLLKLWSVCAGKLQLDALPIHVSKQYIHSLLKFLTHINRQILLRVQTDHALLYDYIKLFKLLPEIKSAMHFTFDRQPDHIPHYHFALWSTITESEKILSPLTVITEQPLALEMMFKVEKYVLQKIATDKLNVFKALAQENSDYAMPLSPSALLREINTRLNIQGDDSDALKVAGMIKLYGHLLKIMNKDGSALSLSMHLNKLIEQAKDQPLLNKSRGYLPLLKELRDFSESYFSSQAKSLSLKPVSKRCSLLLK